METGTVMRRSCQQEGSRMPLRVGVYPGTFDPVTNGHLDIIERAARRLCDRLIVSVAASAGKTPLFPLEERAEILRIEIAALQARHGPALGEIRVVSFDSLLVAHARAMQAQLVVRGLRAMSDFDYEFQMTGMNARLDGSIETVFLMASERNQFISSRFVRDICALGGDISQFVPEEVRRRLLQRLVGV